MTTEERIAKIRFALSEVTVSEERQPQVMRDARWLLEQLDAITLNLADVKEMRNEEGRLLRDALAAAQKDSAHLDWMQSNVVAITTRDGHGAEHEFRCDAFHRADEPLRDALDDLRERVDLCNALDAQPKHPCPQCGAEMNGWHSTSAAEDHEPSAYFCGKCDLASASPSPVAALQENTNGNV